MSFIRLFIGKESGLVRHVWEKSVPFEQETLDHDGAEELTIHDLGFVLDHEWRDASGSPTTPAHHFFLRLQGLSATKAEERTRQGDMPKIHPCPCSMDGLKDLVRAKGTNAIPAVARAWLAVTLPPHHVEALGVSVGMPISVVKAAEAIRYKRDPASGSRRDRLEAIAQRMSDQRAARDLAARRKGGG